MRAYWAALVAAITAAVLVAVSEACSCMPAHPQQHYCNADFVILARIKRKYETDSQRIYKTRVRKEFKMSEKARTALKSGRLITASQASACGVDLHLGQLYLITGHVTSLRAHVSLCDFVRPWKETSRRQRKGFRRMYGLGCDCRIRLCWLGGGMCRRSKDECGWSTFLKRKDCQGEEGICLRSHSKKCSWSKNAAQISCMRNQTTPAQPPPRLPSAPQEKHHPRTENNKQLTISRWSG